MDVDRPIILVTGAFGKIYFTGFPLIAAAAIAASTALILLSISRGAIDRRHAESDVCIA